MLCVHCHTGDPNACALKETIVHRGCMRQETTRVEYRDQISDMMTAAAAAAANVAAKSEMTMVMMTLALLCTVTISATADRPGMNTEADEFGHRVKRDEADVADKTWDIITIEHAPYMYKEGNKYSGFIKDVLDILSKRMRFSYNLRLVKDGHWGTIGNETQSWNGMIGEVKNGTADMAAAPLVITRAREQVVDFVMPFQHVGLTILVKKPHMTEDGFKWPFTFSIFSPLEPEVWALVTIITIIVASVLWFLNRFNPYDYGSRLERGLATEQEAESFHLSGALWFVFTTLQWQGYDRSPRSVASKILGIFWFAFVTLTLVTYTASVVNHLFWASTVHGKDPTQPPIRDLEDLITSTEYSYGIVRGGNTFRYLTQAARGMEFQLIREYLATERGQANLVHNLSEGVAKVRKEKYALIMDSMQAKHAVNNPADGLCDLMTVGTTFALRSQGFVLPENSPHIEEFHHAILEMQESGELDYLEQKWWIHQGKCWNVSRIEKMIFTVSALNVNEPKRVGLAMFWGALLWMAMGIILSILACAVEMLYFKYRGRYQSSNRARGQKLADEPEPNL